MSRKGTIHTVSRMQFAWCYRNTQFSEAASSMGRQAPAWSVPALALRLALERRSEHGAREVRQIMLDAES
jgi:hypothetical protein